jgi:hypothetical protein
MPDKHKLPKETITLAETRHKSIERFSKAAADLAAAYAGALAANKHWPPRSRLATRTHVTPPKPTETCLRKRSDWSCIALDSSGHSLDTSSTSLNFVT